MSILNSIVDSRPEMCNILRTGGIGGSSGSTAYETRSLLWLPSLILGCRLNVRQDVLIVTSLTSTT